MRLNVHFHPASYMTWQDLLYSPEDLRIDLIKAIAPGGLGPPTFMINGTFFLFLFTGYVHNKFCATV